MAEVMDRIAVKVGGVEITAAAIAAEAQNHPASDAEEAWESAAEALVVRQLLIAEAERLGITPNPFEDEKGRRLMPEDAKIEALLAQEVVVPTANEDEARRFFEQHSDRFMSETLIEAEHILLSAHPDDSLNYNIALSEARALIRQIDAQPAKFAELARGHSACPSKDQGGNLGQISYGQTVPEFEEALFSLGEGELCLEPVKSPFGVHVVRAGRRIDGKQLPFETVKASICSYLEEASYRRAVAQYLAILASRTEIEGVTLPTSDGPLVQ